MAERRLREEMGLDLALTPVFELSYNPAPQQRSDRT